MTRLLKGSYSQREVVLVACEKLFGVNECGVILMRFLSRASLLFLWLSISYMPMSTSAYTLSSPMHVHALRLQPGDDLVQAPRPLRGASTECCVSHDLRGAPSQSAL